LTGEDLGLPPKLIAKLRHQRTIVSLDKRAWEIVHKAVTKARTPFKNLRNWESMLRAPETEQEAIVLFSKLSTVLGMKLEYMTRPFPDAGIMVKEGRNWVAKSAEFELLASDFIRHGHPKTMKDKHRECDYIICWENDLKQRFRGVTVVELKGELLRLL
jgi:hypothetical protein